MAAIVAVLIAVLIQAMMRGWRRRAEHEAQLIGTLPAMPDMVGPAIVPATKGLYIGSTLAPHWNDRVAVGDLGFRAKAVLTRYPEGIMLQRRGAGPIWIPDESITAIRTERGMTGKVIPGSSSSATRREGRRHQGILAIRWQLPSGTEIDTGFRANDRREYSLWVEQEAA